MTRTHLCRYPKLYPEKAAPILTIVEPLSGITKQQQADLQQIIRDEAQKMKGGVMVFDVCCDTFLSVISCLTVVALGHLIDFRMDGT